MKGRARLEPGRPAIDLKEIRAPLVVFSSHGDQITPPAQALKWILDIYIYIRTRKNYACSASASSTY
ncbi:DUF3141 domain-containing protein [Sinorhizobium alkalisoli]|uniref:DUF3141 domain-containing protein n=2 Tax=Sinorhizobium alkalisoli TaxID=1752398 RepID=UPI0013F4DAB8